MFKRPPLIDNPFLKHIIAGVSLFLLAQFVIVLLPGPTYYVGFLLLLFFCAYSFTKDITVACFIIYLIVFTNNNPFIFWYNHTSITLDFFLVKPILIPLYEELPLRMIISLLTTISILFNRNLTFSKLTSIFSKSRSFLLIILLLLFNQLFGSYQATFNLSFIALASIILLTVNTLAVLSLQPKLVSFVLVVFILSFIIFEGSIGILQAINTKTLGISIEYVQSTNTFDSNPLYYRSPGTFSHPNYLASNLCILTIMLITMITTTLKSHRNNSVSVILLSTLTIIGTVSIILSKSRFAFLILIILTAILIYPKKKIIRNFLILTKTRLFVSVFLISSLLLFSLFSLTLRGDGLTTFEGRAQVIKQALSIVTKYPIFGTGPGLSTYSIAEFFPYRHIYLDSIRTIHSSIFLFITDNGLIVSIVLFVTILKISIDARIHSKNNLIVRIFYFGVLAYILNSFGYPLYIYDSSSELLFISLAVIIFYSQLSKRNNQAIDITQLFQ